MGGIAILDQGVFSGANFIVSILLARWLEPRQFGEFAIGFTTLVFFMQIYTSFILEPMGVLGPSNYGNRLATYLRTHVTLLFLLIIPVALLLATVMLLVMRLNRDFLISQTLIYTLLGLPLILFPLLMRRVYYVLLKPEIALLGSVVYLIGLMGCMLLFRETNELTGTAGVLIVLFAGLVSGSLMLFFLRHERSTSQEIDLKSVWLETWVYGRWLLLSGLLIGLATQSHVYLAGVLSRLEDAGTVRILQTFIQPMMLTSTAFSALATPALSADFAAGAYGSMRRKVLLFTLALSGVAICYEVLLILLGNKINVALFGNKYLLPSYQIATWGLLPVLLSLFWGGVMALQASQNPYAMAIVSIFWSGLSIASALVLIPRWGVWGATISMALGFLAALVATWILFWLWFERKFFLKDRRLNEQE